MSFGWKAIDVSACRYGTRLFFTLAIPLFLVMGSVRLLMSYEFIRFEYQRSGFPADFYGFTTSDRLEYGLHAIGFLFSSDEIDILANLRLPLDKCWQAPASASDCALFNATELRHLEDVKAIIAPAFSLGLALGIVAFAQIMLSLRTGMCRRDIFTGARRGSLLVLGLIMASVVLTLTSWDTAFDNFHQVFFADGTWRFPYSDSLIRLYPEQLFVDAALAIALLCSVAAVLMLFLLSRWEDRSR